MDQNIFGVFILCALITIGYQTRLDSSYHRIQKHLRKHLDASCENKTLPSNHNNAILVGIKQISLHNDISKHYLMAKFKCRKGYKLINSGKFYCSRKKWHGKTPLCQVSLDISECPPGFRISDDGKSCEDINECHLRNGHGPCQDTCMNTQGSYKCSCSNLKNTKLADDIHTCSYINECTLEESGCSHNCVKTHGKTYCTCPDGMTIGSDWKTCQDINECENPEINKECKYGCKNFIGSYICLENPNEMLLADEPVEDNEIISDDDDNEEYQESYDDEDYGEEYDEDNYDEEGEVIDDRKNDDLGKENTLTKDDSISPKETNKNDSLDGGDDYDRDKYEVSENNTILHNNQLEKEKQKTLSEADTTTSTEDNDIQDQLHVNVDYYSKKDILEKEEKPLEESVNRISDQNEINENGKIDLREDNKENNYDEDEYDISDKELGGSTNRDDSETMGSTHKNERVDEGGYPDEYNKNVTENKLDLSTSNQEESENTSMSRSSMIDETIKAGEDVSNVITDRTESIDVDQSTDNSITETSTIVNIVTVQTITENDDADLTTMIISTEKNEDTIDRIAAVENYDEETDYDDEEYDEDYNDNLNRRTGEHDKTEVVNAPNTTPVDIGLDDDYDDSDNEIQTDKESEINTDKKCDDGYEMNATGNCVDTDECTPETNPCSDMCENTIGSFLCHCPFGHELSQLDPYTCKDIDECDKKPCSHICTNTIGSFYCNCPQGLTLQNLTCVNLTCSHDQTRVNGQLQCTCPPGYILGDDNRTCEDVDECLLGDVCSHNCDNTIGSYVCSCPIGFELKDYKVCVDIDECKSNHSCSQLCQNTLGSYKCSCQDGYEYQIENNTCVDIDECSELTDLDECNQICINYNGGYECGCHSGYELGNDPAICVDINECSTYNNTCSQNCENLPGSFRCTCDPGYIIGKDNSTCTILDPCLDDNGGCSHLCENQNGTAVCKCPRGQVLEGKDCWMYDPCITKNGGCSDICVNANGAVRCECPEGYRLENETICVEINPCTVNNGNCSHFCEFIDGKVKCLCPETHSLSNESLCVENNPCLHNNGGCSHTCHFKERNISCSCPLNYELSNKTHCTEVNLCLINNGGCSGGCQFKNGAVICTCPKNYELGGKLCYRIDPCLDDNGGCSHNCDVDDDETIICSCPENLMLRNDGKTCIPKNPCLINNGNCSHICNSLNHTDIICSCPVGFTLVDNTTCKENNPCNDNNGGCSDICENYFGRAGCSCPDNYILENSRTCIKYNPCYVDNGGCSHICEDVNSEPQCSCPDHHNLVNKTSCELVDPCLINNGGCSHECSSDNSVVVCSCPENYVLNGKTCELTDPCENKNGGCSHICSNHHGEVVCTCFPGYELINKACLKKDPCLLNNGGCSHNCVNIDGKAECKCPPGYKIFGKICLDEDPCAKNNGGCSHYCHSKEGNRDCSCPPGYLLRPNKRICKEINECRINRGGCSHGCRNLMGSYECTCPNGFILDNVSNKTCIDVDECLKENGGCDMICRNFVGGHRCDCPQGYSLMKDQRSCRKLNAELQCSVPKAPSNGFLRCLEQISDHGSLVPGGTKCLVWCNEGYRLIGESQMTCNRSGLWQEAEPKCIISSCPKLPHIQNGWYLPGICNSGRIYPGESCEIYCRNGFKSIMNIQRYRCSDEMDWIPSVDIDLLMGACVRTFRQTVIKCPGNGQLDFVLPPGERYMSVRIPRPETNVVWNRYVTSVPPWGIRLENILPAGRTEIKFTALAEYNSSSSCNLIINIMDKEIPQVMGCPDNIEKTVRYNERYSRIYWKEPQFYDNVGIAKVYKSKEPGDEFDVGIHHINYIATDESGNRAFCQFSITIKAEQAPDTEIANSIQTNNHQTYNYNQGSASYRAVLICPSGVQYMAKPPDSYNNIITSEAGCIWRHVRVNRPIQPQNYKVPKVYSESKLPANVRSNRRVFFKWSR